MKKNWISIFICVLLLGIFVLPMGVHAATTSGSCGDEVTWSVNEDGTVLTISGNGAIDDCTTVVVNNVVESDAPWADYCESIKEIVIGDGITTIGKYAFYNCRVAETVEIADSVEEIRDNAFQTCTGITSIVLPENLKKLGYRSFSYCTKLASVTIGKSLESMQLYVFDGCSAIESFYVSTENPNFSAKDGVLFDKAKTTLLIYPPAKKDTNYEIPSTVTTIAHRGFQRCNLLESLKIPESVKVLESNAIIECNKLASVDIHDNITSLGVGAIISIPAIVTENSINYIGKYAVGGSYDITTANIKEGTVGMSEQAFASKSKLTRVTIPSTLKNIPARAFESSTKLNYVTIPANIKSIGEYAFYGCSSLSQLTLSEGLERIDYRAFANCGYLSKLSIPSSVNYIDCNAFYGTGYFNNDDNWVVDNGSSALYNNNKLLYIKSVSSHFIIKDGIDVIAYYSFYDPLIIKSVFIPKSVKYINDRVFDKAERRFTSFSDVYYQGTEEEWNKIVIGEDNDSLREATIHFNSVASPTVSNVLNSDYSVTTTVTIPEGVVEDKAMLIVSAYEPEKIYIWNENTGTFTYGDTFKPIEYGLKNITKDDKTVEFTFKDPHIIKVYAYLWSADGKLTSISSKKSWNVVPRNQ